MPKLSRMQWTHSKSQTKRVVRVIIYFFTVSNKELNLWLLTRTPKGLCVCGGGPLVFSYIRRVGSFMGVQNFKFQYFWGFQQNNYFLGMKILWIFFGVITKLDYIKGLFLCILWSFLRVIVENGDIFWGC